MPKTYPYYVHDSLRVVMFKSTTDCLTVSEGANGKFYIGSYNDPGTIAYYNKLPECSPKTFARAFKKAIEWIDNYLPQTLKDTFHEIS